MGNLAEKTTLKEPVSEVVMKEIQESIDHFDHEMKTAFDNQVELLERKRILELSMKKITSGMALSIVQNMVEELQDEINKQKERERFCRNNKKYYEDIKEAVDEVLYEI